MESGGVRLLPGLSYTYGGDLPRQWGVTVDGDDLSPVLLSSPDETPPFADYLPSSVAFRLRPDALVLILEARGGLDPLAALNLDARFITAQEGNELVLHATEIASPAGVYASQRVRVAHQDARSFLRADGGRYDIIQLSLTQPFRPVTSGAYSLAEDYTLTVEAFADMLTHLETEGVLVVTRWLQTPPSEDLRALALAIEGLARLGMPNPQGHIIAFRGIQTVTVLAKREVFTREEIATVREFAEARRYDLVVAPGLKQEESNRFNVQPKPVHFETLIALMSAPDRRDFYRAYPFDVTPPTDDHPFFFHFFRWGQTPAILQSLGKTWQPFGGSGYFVLLALLILAILAAFVLIVLPLLLGRVRVAESSTLRAVGRPFLYFSMIGIGFLWLEIPLIGRFILTLEQPAYAFSGVLFSLLLFSGLGSLAAPRQGRRGALIALTLIGLGVAVWLPLVLYGALTWPLWLRFALTTLSLSPLGFLLGIAFPKGLDWLEGRAPDLIPWAWAVNGSISVVASVLAAILILSLGYRAVLLLGSLAYAIAFLVIAPLASEGRRIRP